MIYGIVCFATLLSFVGTVLGGIWADQSWGRFWGWDPKENGALLDRHLERPDPARPLGRHGQGTAAWRSWPCSATSSPIWSWFGTNQLGVGLHAYGASSGDKRMWIDFAWATHLAIGLTAALIPLRFWPSFSPAARKAALAARKATVEPA